jgi:ESCRT-I complex subunit VPS28
MNLEKPELYEEVKLYNTPKERESYNNQANLFAILSTLEQLEKAYMKDCIKANEYTTNCSNLLSQFKTAFRLVEKEFPNVEDFVKKYNLDCPIASVRIKEDRPLTIKDETVNPNSSKSIAQTVQLFITLMDKLRLGIVANDELQPDFRELIDVMNRLTLLSADSEAKLKIQKWYTQLQQMSASDEINEEQSRDILLDLETAYYAFNQAIDS